MKIDALENNLAETPVIAKALRDDCQSFKKTIDSAIAALNKPKQVDDKLKSLSANLGALSSGLTVAKVVRPIRIVAGRLKTNVNAVKKSVDNAESKAKALDEKAKPIRDKLKALSKKIGSLIKQLDRLISNSTSALNNIKTVHRCINSQPDQLRKLGLKQLNDFARVSNPPVLSLNKNMRAVNETVDIYKQEINKVTTRLNQLQKILKGMVSIQNVINPIMGPLKKLLGALNYKIDIKIFSFSIRQILEGIRLPWPFSYLEKAFWATANKILDPILKALKLDVKLPGIPGLKILGQIKLDIFDKLPDFTGMFDDLARLFSNLYELIKRFNVSCPPKKSALKTSELIAQELKGLKPKLRTA